MSRLSRLAVSKRSVTLLLAFALFIAGISAWGSLKQELLPDIDFPVITVVAPFPAPARRTSPSRSPSRSSRSSPASRGSRPVQSTSANSIALVVAQFSYGTNVKETTAAVQEAIAKAGLPATVDPNVSALNINASPVIIASIASTDPGRASPKAADIARTEIVPEIQAIDGVARADLTGGLETASRRHPRPDEAGGDGRLGPAGRRASSRRTT